MEQVGPAEGRATQGLERVFDACLRHKGCAKEYYVAPIPEAKIANARRTMNIPSVEMVIALVDFTIFGSAEEAMVVTESGIYWRNIGDRQPNKLSWVQLRDRTIKKKEGLLTQDVDFGNGLKMDLSGAGELAQNKSDVVITLIKELAAVRTTSNAEKSEDADTPQTEMARRRGMVECEFCRGHIKPDVTYCKHCGIKLRG